MSDYEKNQVDPEDELPGDPEEKEEEEDDEDEDEDDYDFDSYFTRSMPKPEPVEPTPSPEPSEPILGQAAIEAKRMVTRTVAPMAIQQAMSMAQNSPKLKSKLSDPAVQSEWRKIVDQEMGEGLASMEPATIAMLVNQAAYLAIGRVAASGQLKDAPRAEKGAKGEPSLPTGINRMLKDFESKIGRKLNATERQKFIRDWSE